MKKVLHAIIVLLFTCCLFVVSNDSNNLKNNLLADEMAFAKDFEVIYGNISTFTPDYYIKDDASRPVDFTYARGYFEPKIKAGWSYSGATRCASTDLWHKVNGNWVKGWEASKNVTYYWFTNTTKRDDVYFFSPDCGRMWDGTKYVKIDVKAYVWTNNKLGSAFKGNEAGGVIGLSQALHVTKEKAQLGADEYISQGCEWGYNGGEIYVEIHFYYSGTATEIPLSSGTVLFNDLDEGEGIGASAISVKYAALKGHKLAVQDTNMSLKEHWSKSSRLVVGTENANSDNSPNKYSIGVCFQSSPANPLLVTYRYCKTYGTRFDEKHSNVKYHLDNNYAPTGIDKPGTVRVFNWCNVPAANEEMNIEGYVFSGWRTGNSDGPVWNGTSFINGDVDVYGKYTQISTTATVVKSWDDFNNAYGDRPDSITVQLQRTWTGDGGVTNIGNPVTLSAANNWQATAGDLPTYWNHQAFSWNWVETTTSEYYDKSSQLVAGALPNYPGYSTFTTYLTNKLKTVKATVAITWDDSGTWWDTGQVVGNCDGFRPDAIYEYLYDGETSVSYAALCNTVNGYTYTVEGLPKYRNKNLCNYNFKQLYDPNKYTKVVNTTTDASGNFTTTITNIHTVVYTSAQVQAVWDDLDDIDLIRPETLNVDLYRNNIKVGTYPCKSGEGYFKQIDGLNTYRNGQQLSYYIRQSGVPYDYTNTGNVDSHDETRLHYGDLVPTWWKAVITDHHRPNRNLTVRVKVPKSEVYEPFSSPSFVMRLKVRGVNSKARDHYYYQMLTPTVVQSDNNNLYAEYTWRGLIRGTYEVDQLPVDRYRVGSVLDLTNGVESNRSAFGVPSKCASLDLTTITEHDAGVTLVNNIKNYKEYTHTGKHVGRLR